MTDSCLDAETLAAWVDGGLTAPELEQAQAHVAGCLRCQAMVGTLARIAAAAPHTVKAEAAPRRWLVWLAPFAAAAAAVTIWVAIPASNLDTRVPTAQLPAAPTTLVAPTTPAAPAEQAEAKARSSVPPPSPAQTALPAPLNAAVAAPVPERAKEARSDKAALAAPPPAALDKLTQEAGTSTRTGMPAAAPPPMPTGPTGPTPQAQGGVGASANALGTLRSALRQEATSSVEIISPDPQIRWRLAGSDVERSTNGGGTWEMTRTGINTPLTSGAAPSPTVVWVVGGSGAVLVSTDGRTWRRVPFPQTTNLSAIRARDARSVSVSTADGRIFSTSDAGATWVPGPLQGF